MASNMSSPGADISSESTPTDDFNNDFHHFMLRIKSPGSFSTTGTFEEFPIPDIRTPDRRFISFPISKAYIERSGIEFTASGAWEQKNVHFSNPAWTKFVKRLAIRAAQELGIEADVVPIFRTMVVHESDASTKMCRNKSDELNTFATLVLCLPCGHSGGAIEVCHGFENIHYNTDVTSRYALSYFAWYADAWHELRPVTSGYQVILRYDLAANPRLVVMSGMERTITNYRGLLARWASLEQPYLMIPLEHSYTTSRMAEPLLNRSDAGRAKILKLSHLSNHQEPIFAQFTPLLACIKRTTCTQDGKKDGQLGQKLILHDIGEFDGGDLEWSSPEIIVDPKFLLPPSNSHETRTLGLQYFRGVFKNREDADGEYNNVVILLTKNTWLPRLLLGEDMALLKWPSCLMRRIYRMLGSLQKDLLFPNNRTPQIDRYTLSLDRTARQWLARLYEWCITGQDSQLGIAALCAVYLKDATSFCAAVDKLGSHFEAETFNLLGKAIDVDDSIFSIRSLQESLVKTDSLTAVWTSAQSFINGSQSVRSSIQLQCLTRSSVHHILKTSPRATLVDAGTLKAIILELEGAKSFWTSVMFEGISAFLTRHHDKEDFINEFMCISMHSSHPVLHRLVVSNLPAACLVFKLDRFFRAVDWQHGHFENILRFLTLVGDHVIEEMPGLLVTILEQAKNIVKDGFLCLLKILFPHPTCSLDFCQKLAGLYLAEQVGQEPEMRGDWVRSVDGVVHCFNYDGTCHRCQDVRKFLVDPYSSKRLFRFDVDVLGKKDLEMKKDSRGWEITKITRTTSRQEYDHNAWHERLVKFKEEMAKIGSRILSQKLGSKGRDIFEGRIMMTGYVPSEQMLIDQSD